MSDRIAIADDDVLLVVDMQNDFCPGGALAVPRGDTIVPTINRVARFFSHVVLTQDWHPPGHFSFASSHPGSKPHDIIAVSYGRQELWPDHCIQGSSGAAFRTDFSIPQAQMVLRKGYHMAIDSYSAFRENDRTTKTGLAGYLGERGLKRVFIAGLALDFCVRYSVEDARRDGFTPLVLDDACAAIDIDGSLAAARASFQDLSIQVISSNEII
jgi:nicotinamidase/pyrazinamidase